MKTSFSWPQASEEKRERKIETVTSFWTVLDKLGEKNLLEALEACFGHSDDLRKFGYVKFIKNVALWIFTPKMVKTVIFKPYEIRISYQ